MAYTIDNFLADNPNYTKQWDPNTNTATIVNNANNSKISFGINQGQNYGLGSSDLTGSHEISDMTKFINSFSGASSTYQSPYKTQMDIVNKQITDRPAFIYNPYTDGALRQAQQQATQNTMETTNERGLLNSTITTDRVAQAVAALVPQYEQLAYGRYNDETNQLYQKANYIMNLDNEGYKRYQDGVQNSYNQQKFDYQKSQDDIANKRDKVNDAWNKVKNIGYVDNEASIILGVPVGTPTWEAKKAADDRQFDLDKMDKDNNLKMAQIDKNYQNDVKILGIRASIENENADKQLGREKEMSDYNTNNQIKVANSKAEKSTTGELTNDDYYKSASGYIDDFFITKDNDGNKSLTMQNKRDIAKYIYNLAMNSVPSPVTDALFAKYEIDYDFLKELGLAE